MAQIDFRKIISTNNGVGATTGKEGAQFFNDNFRIVKENLEAIWQILELVVSSHNIEGIRVKPVMDKEDPTKLLYTLFEYNLDGDLENGEWFPIEVLFDNIVGDPLQNDALRKIINELTPLSRFIPVEIQVASNTSTIGQHEKKISDLQENDASQDYRLDQIEAVNKQQQTSLRTKANQVLELFDIIAKGSDYRVGTTLMDQASNYVLEVLAVDQNGGILSVGLSDLNEASSYYIVVDEGGSDYQVDEVIATTDPNYNAKVTVTDVNGCILQAIPTTDPVTENTFGRNAVLSTMYGSGAIVSMTTYPTIHFQCIHDGLQEKIVFYLNGDLTSPHDIVAYPDFVNVQNIIDSSTSSYYELLWVADSEFAENYIVGDSFTIDGTNWTGTITDISTDPYTITTDIPLNVMTNMKGTYTTTAVTGLGTGLQIELDTIYHPQITTNTEFNTYMERHDDYLINVLNNSMMNMNETLLDLIKNKASQEQLDSHLRNDLNPHNVTKEQVGLSEVDNTSDLDKPISKAVQNELDDIRNKAAGLKKSLAVSTDYYNMLRDSGQLDSSVIYFVSNLNVSFETTVTIDTSNITSPYSVGDRLLIDKTNWYIEIIDPTASPITFTDYVDNVLEYNAEGTYSTTNINGTGEGILVNIHCIRY